MFMVTFLSKIHPACHNDANRIKPGSNSNMTDKHAAECSKAAYLDSQGYIRFRLFWKYAEIGYFG